MRREAPFCNEDAKLKIRLATAQSLRPSFCRIETFVVEAGSTRHFSRAR